MIVVDTNVLIHAANSDAPEHDNCRRFLASLRNSPVPWHTTWSIAYEFLRVVTHARVFTRPMTAESAASFLNALYETPSHSLLTASYRHAHFLREVIAETPGVAGNLMHDLHTVVLMKEHGIRRVCTLDSDFHRFPGIEVVNPLA